MSNKLHVGSGSKEDLLESYTEILEITDGMRNSAYEIIVANAKVVEGLPSVLNQLESNKTSKEDVNKVISVAKTIAKDTDSFMKELGVVDDKFLDIKNSGKRSAKVASKNYANVLSISTRYHDIIDRLSTTTGDLVNDFTDMCIEFGIADEDELKEAMKDEEVKND